MKPRQSQGTGEFVNEQLLRYGVGIVFEAGVRIFHPENIEVGSHVYVGHDSIIKGYYKNRIVIGDGSWIGPMCFLHGAGGITIGKNVGVGPAVKIITSMHEEEGIDVPILHSKLKYAPVVIADDCDLGVGSIILPGIRLGRGVQVGAGSVVTHSIPDYAVAAGVPARILRSRV